MGAAQDGRAARAVRYLPVAVEQIVDLREPAVDADELCASLGEQVLAEAPAPVELDEQPAQVAELLLPHLEQRALLAPEQPCRRAPRRDALGAGTRATPPAAERPHAKS